MKKILLSMMMIFPMIGYAQIEEEPVATENPDEYRDCIVYTVEEADQTTALTGNVVSFTFSDKVVRLEGDDSDCGEVAYVEPSTSNPSGGDSGGDNVTSGGGSNGGSSDGGNSTPTSPSSPTTPSNPPASGGDSGEDMVEPEPEPEPEEPEVEEPEVEDPTPTPTPTPEPEEEKPLCDVAEDMFISRIEDECPDGYDGEVVIYNNIPHRLCRRNDCSWE